LFQKSGYNFEMLYFELEDVVGRGNVSTRGSDKMSYSVDNFFVPRMWVEKGQKPESADFIVHVETAKQISDIMKIANYYRIPVIAWGGGSGSQGGSLPIYGGIIIDTKKMNKIIEINEQSYTATAEAGIIQRHFEWEVNKQDRSLMHIPASIGCATLGGYIAHRGTGVLSTKYGKIEDLIVNMEVVLPNGDIIDTLSVPRNAAGPDLNQLFCGSEGVYGIITKATVKMFDMPEERRFRAFMFHSMHDAYEAGRKLMTKGLQPSVIRMYDEYETQKMIKRVLGLDKDGAYLVFGFDGFKDVVDILERKAIEICNETAYEDLGAEMGKEWWDNKYHFFFPPYCLDNPKMYGTMDTVASYDKLEAVYWAMKKVVETEFENVHFMAHFSHWYEWGAMMYDRFFIDPEHVPADPHEAMMLHNSIWNAAVRAAMKHGGIINEHHGVGLKLGRLMKEQYGPAFQVLQGIKKQVDPNNIMNPGKMGL